MIDKIEELSSEDIDVEALETRLELIDPGLDSGYYCYAHG